MSSLNYIRICAENRLHLYKRQNKLNICHASCGQHFETRLRWCNPLISRFSNTFHTHARSINKTNTEFMYDFNCSLICLPRRRNSSINFVIEIILGIIQELNRWCYSPQSRIVQYKRKNKVHIICIECEYIIRDNVD